MSPKVTVIVASYNYEQFIEETLRSIAGQTFEDFEVLVIDDGSKDHSCQIVQKFVQEDIRFHLLTHPNHQNKGLSETIQIGLDKARGTWIAFLESDDIWMKDCLEKRFQVINKYDSDEIGIAINNIEPIVMAGADSSWFNSYVPRVLQNIQSEGEKGSPIDLSNQMLEENYFPTFSAVMLKKEVFKQCSFDTPVGKWLDWFLWIQAVQFSKVVYYPGKLTLWRLHPNSWNHKQSLSQYVKDYDLFRSKVAEVLLPLFKEREETSKITCIRRSSIYFLLKRFLVLVRSKGLTGTISNILKRLR